ncbi:cysteine-rich DPF motif domain-containing protein 1-like [Pomacea canaliculata]|uniref:cysteine-rich DPF motif domain-containing protein 1-like n=1 Tax=Pomacea canaliculata TaxID=400727 RepID=UPI000D733DD6|nr:cysteine-rich DPF motif domain-containing protein 1-like [Pomacea canaliculata]
MATNVSSAAEKSKQFTCKLCDFSIEYHYFGTKPPFAKAVVLLEECYIMKDPFSTTGGFITIGGICSVCGINVCMSNDCSLFYTRRFCIPCVLKHVKEFPKEIQQEVERKRQER